MEAKRQRFFYLISFFLIGSVLWSFEKDTATMAALFNKKTD